ncbi:MAG: hypothetical protein RMX96_02515 [Nostoc sp. ChiSLP02]|nr:hypothetical protein [Nostoc sp. ChiSLP02]
MAALNEDCIQKSLVIKSKLILALAMRSRGYTRLYPPTLLLTETLRERERQGRT